MLASKSKRRVRPIYLVAVALGLLALILWLRHLNQNLADSVDPLNNPSADEDIYLVIRGIHLRRFDHNGDLTMIVLADEGYQNAQDKPLALHSVTVTSHGTEQGESVELARIISRYAVYDPLLATLSACQKRSDCFPADSDNRYSAKLSQAEPAEVMPTSTPVQLFDYTTTPMTLVKSSRLLYDTQTRKVTNNEHTSILRGENLLTGIGLIADLSSHHYQIQRDVKTTFIESTPTTSHTQPTEPAQ